MRIHPAPSSAARSSCRDLSAANVNERTPVLTEHSKSSQHASRSKPSPDQHAARSMCTPTCPVQRQVGKPSLHAGRMQADKHGTASNTDRNAYVTSPWPREQPPTATELLRCARRSPGHDGHIGKHYVTWLVCVPNRAPHIEPQSETMSSDVVSNLEHLACC